MRTSVYIVLSGLLLAACGTVKFEQQALYNGYAEPAEQEKIAAVIYEDAAGTMWNSLFDCGEFEVTQDLAYSGKACIRLTWDKGKGCEWIGFGNSFSNWEATDMSEERKKKALSFYARTQTGTARSIPIVAAMEDFGGGGSYHFIDAKKYLDGLELDTTWKQIIVPLWDFPIQEEEVDIYSIKQMQFQLEGAGSFYLDDIRLIDYTTEEYEAMRAQVETLKPKGKPEQHVYTEGQFLEDAWGYQNNSCQQLTEEIEGDNRYINWNYQGNDCSWSKWGINWNGWYAMNFRGVEKTSVLRFRIKASPQAGFSIWLKDFAGHRAQVYERKSGASTTGWHEVAVPLKTLDLTEKQFVIDQIRELEFVGTSAGEVSIDDIKITAS